MILSKVFRGKRRIFGHLVSLDDDVMGLCIEISLIKSGAEKVGESNYCYLRGAASNDRYGNRSIGGQALSVSDYPLLSL